AGWFQLLFVVTVVGAAILLSIALKPEPSASYGTPSADPVVVSIVEPEALLFEPWVNLNGVVEARTITDVIPQVGGMVIEVSPAFRPGAEFSKGDVLFRIDAADYDLAVERTLAEIEAARSELALLEAQAAAERQIWDQQFGDRKIPDLIAKVPQIAAANARIHSGEAARAAAELSLSRTSIRAPFDGRVLVTQLDVGQVVGAGVTVGSVFSVDSLEIAVPVSADELAMLGNVIGRRAAVSREATADSALTAEVVRQSAGLDDRTRLRTLFLTPDRSDDLTLGEFVGLQIRGQAAPQALRLPAAALTSRDKVWVVDDGRLRMREVDVVGNEGNFAVVRSFDMANGVVAVPPSSGREGLPVTIQPERQSLLNSGSQVVGTQ
ncbi:MAG: efflux RND transporter periplasmic adaptor subunit, partial [Gammaproteobacteria bacterium]|nr:efflux RND transporter periplasmic adaptor subunit [Gammaproteobacteria bacterium]